MGKFRNWLGNLIKGSGYNGRPQSVITAEMTEKANAMKRQAYQLRQLEKQAEMQKRFEALENMISTQKSGSMEDKLMEQVLPILLKKLATPSNNTPIIEEKPVNQVELTKEQIKTMLDKNPKLRQNGKIATDEQIHEFLVQNIPNISQNSIKTVIAEIRNDGN